MHSITDLVQQLYTTARFYVRAKSLARSVHKHRSYGAAIRLLRHPNLPTAVPQFAAPTVTPQYSPRRRSLSAFIRSHTNRRSREIKHLHTNVFNHFTYTTLRQVNAGFQNNHKYFMLSIYGSTLI